MPGDLLHPVSFMVALSIVVYLHVVLGEMVPKNIALAGPEKAAIMLGPPMMAVVTVLGPVIVGLNAIANGTLRLLRVEPRDEVSSTYTREEVAALVEESRGEGLLEADEYDRLSGALGFTQRTVESVLLPMESLSTLPQGATAADVEDICAATGYSRFPVVDPTGAPTGYLHIKDVLEPERRELPIQDKWVHPFASVRARDPLHAALETLQRRGAHMARVVADDGETLGLATLEDVLEELIGEIRDGAHQDDTAGAT